MDLLINSFAAPNDITYATNVVNDFNNNFGVHKKSLTAKARKGLRAVGSSRYGLVKIVDKLARQYDSKLSKGDNAVELTNRIEYLDRIRQYKIAVQNLYEALDDTDKAIGQDVMAYVDKFSSSLQVARQHDGDLDEAMKELDLYNARFGATMDEEDEEDEEAPAKDEPSEPPVQS